MDEARAVKFCTHVGYIKSYQKNEKSPANVAWLWSRDKLKFLVSPTISPERLKLEITNFILWFVRWRFSIGIAKCPLNGRGHGHATSLDFQK